MCVMWFRASDTVKPTFSKCFVVLSVMLRGEFSFCFALGQTWCRDKISSRGSEFGIACVKAEAVWGNVLCLNQEGTEGKEGALGIKSQAMQVSLAVLPGALHGRRSGCTAPSRVWMKKDGSGLASLQFNKPCRMRSTEVRWSRIREQFRVTGTISLSPGLILQDWAGLHKKIWVSLPCAPHNFHYLCVSFIWGTTAPP